MTTEYENPELKKQAEWRHGIIICQECKSVYQINLLKLGDDHNDFGIRSCPYCGDITQGLPDWTQMRSPFYDNIYVLIILSGGLIDQVKFYSYAQLALESLKRFVQGMDIENQDVAIYNQDGYFANAKDFLDDNDEFMENPEAFERT